MDIENALDIIDEFLHGEVVEDKQFRKAVEILFATKTLDRIYIKVLTESIAEMTNMERKDVVKKYKQKVEEEITKLIE